MVWQAHFASLINFQTHGENAPECLTLVFYNELQKDKHIVLVKGDFDKDVLVCFLFSTKTRFFLELETTFSVFQ